MPKIAVIPMDRNKPVRLEEVGFGSYYQIAEPFVGGWAEKVTTPVATDSEGNFLVGLEYPATQGLFMMVNETGVLQNLPMNIRASHFYPGPIVGDAVMVNVTEDWTEEGPDWKLIDMPETFVTDFLSIAARSMNWITERMRESR